MTVETLIRDLVVARMEGKELKTLFIHNDELETLRLDWKAQEMYRYCPKFLFGLKIVNGAGLE